jgi:hypothetical protein
VTENPFADEVMAVVLQLFHLDATSPIDEWTTLTPIEAGVLSWHLGNFYFCACGEAFLLHHPERRLHA